MSTHARKHAHTHMHTSLYFCLCQHFQRHYTIPLDPRPMTSWHLTLNPDLNLNPKRNLKPRSKASNRLLAQKVVTMSRSDSHSRVKWPCCPPAFWPVSGCDRQRRELTFPVMMDDVIPSRHRNRPSQPKTSTVSIQVVPEHWWVWVEFVRTQGWKQDV